MAFAEAMASEARIPAALKGQVAAIGTQLQSTPDVEFGGGDAKKPLHELFRDLLRALPPQVEFGEQATRDRAAADGADKASDTPVELAEGADPDRVAQDKRIRLRSDQQGRLRHRSSRSDAQQVIPTHTHQEKYPWDV